jgi:putative ABC transport system permease protein
VRYLLRLVSLRHTLQRPGHALAAVVAVVVGVGAIVAVQLVTDAISNGIVKSFDAFTGRTALRVEAGEGGLDEAVLDTVRAVPGIEVAVPVLTSPAYVVGTAGDVLTVLGVDLDQESQVRRYSSEGDDDTVLDDPLVFLSQPSSIILTRAYAERHALGLDDRVELLTPHGKRAFVVRGLLTARGPAVAFGGNLAVMDYQAAQVAFAKDGRLDEIDVVAAPGVDVDALAARIGDAVGSGLHVEPPERRGAEIALATRSITFIFWLFSALTVIVAVFLIYNVVSLMVAQRGEELAQLRAVGVRRRDGVRLILLEAVVVGVVGAPAGIVFGVALAHVLLRPMDTTVGTALFMTVGSPQLAGLQPRDVASALAVGLLATLVAAWVPAHQATRFAPVVAARRGAVTALRQARLPSAWWGVAGVLTAGAVIALALATGMSRLGPLADAILVVAFTVLAPAVVRTSLPLVARLLGTLGRLAVLNVSSTPQRSALTAAPLMVSVALVVVISTMLQSFRVSLDEWMAGFAEDDFQVASVSHDPARAVLLEESLAAGVAAIDGVERVRQFRIMHASYGGRRIVIEHVDYDAADPTLAHLRFRDGDPRAAFARLAAGEAVVVSQNFAAHFHVSPGDVIDVPTPQGPRPFPVAATVTNYNGDQGSIMMSRGLFVSLFGDGRAQFLLVSGRPGVDPQALRAAIAARYGERYQLVIFSNAELRRDIAGRIDRAFLPASTLLVLGIVVGCVGIANSQQVAVTERRREIGLLRALGARRRDVSRLIVVEAGAIGLVGALLGLALGAVLSYIWVVVHVRHFLGWIIDYHFAGSGALLGVVTSLTTAPLAGWLPAHRAARLPPVLALARE